MPLPVSMDATWLDGSVQFNGQELRRADSALFNGDGTALGVRGGIVRHGDTSLAVTVNGSDLITVQPGAVVIPGNAGVANGCYRAALGAADTGQLAARNATNPRIDLVIFRALDTSVVGSHAAFTGRIEVLTGVAAASPAVPALPTLAIELARVTVPATGAGVATVDSSWRQYAAAIGGTLPVATAARLPATPNAKWLKAVAIDTGMEYVWTGTAWEPDRAPRGLLGIAIATTGPGGIGPTAVDVGLAPAVTVGAGRRVRLRAQVWAQSTAAGDLVTIEIREGATTLVFGTVHLPYANVGIQVATEVILAPSTGAHNYKVVMYRSGGPGGSISMPNGASNPAFLLVEDIGPV